jgi:hypothetical protein
MSTDRLNLFLDKIGSLRSIFPGTIMSSGGFAGAMSSQDVIMEELKRNTVIFATECKKNPTDNVRLSEMANAVEGGLQGLLAVSAISTTYFDELVEDLHQLRS